MRVRAVVDLLRACHPEPAAAVTVLAALLALASGQRWPAAAVTTLTVLASQLAVGWSNDAIDAGRDTAVGRADKPVVTGRIGRRTVAVAAAVAAVATLALAPLSGARAAVAVAVGLVSALLYNWPLKSTVVSVVPYAVSFAALPVFVVLAGGRMPAVWLPLGGALLGAGAHFANVLPDLDDDARTGVRGLPHRFGRGPSALTAAVLLLATTATLTFGPPGPPSWVGSAALAAVVVVLPTGVYAGLRRPGSRATFRAVVLVALVDVALLLAGGLSV